MNPCARRPQLSVAVKIPELLRRLKNQCGLFIHGSNPQICCHLICGYGRALMALILSNRCPCSAAQVGLHLVTPFSPDSRWDHYSLSSGGKYYIKLSLWSEVPLKRRSRYIVRSVIFLKPKSALTGLAPGTSLHVLDLSGLKLHSFVYLKKKFCITGRSTCFQPRRKKIRSNQNMNPAN